MEKERDQPLLSSTEDDHPAGAAAFTPGAADIPPITGSRIFFRQYSVELRKLWFLAGPAIFTTVCRYSLAAVTQIFAGHVSTIALAAVSIENSVIAGFSLGIMMGMGSALETLCGQAVGAGQLDMLGVYLQRSWIILNTAALLLSFLYIFAAPLLRLIGQTEEISEAAGTFAIWMIPQLFAYSINFPILKFLQSQSKVMVLAAITAVTLVLHIFFSWLLIMKFGWGLVGAAVALNASWWFMVIAQLIYIFSGTCGRAWSGFSWKAFHNLWSFARLSLASAVMICVEVWYYSALILFAGYLKNAEISVDALSICMNILGWTTMVTIGMNAAVSVRVSNELGAGHPRTAKFSLMVAVTCSILIGVVIPMVLLLSRNQYPALFSSDTEVEDLVVTITPLLALCIFINTVQPVLTGVAVGAGWQGIVAYVNVACYYLVGVPLGLILSYKLDFGVEGIWLGMLSGTILQTCVLFWMIYRTNWNKEASIAGDRIKKWGGGHEIINQNDEQT